MSRLFRSHRLVPVGGRDQVDADITAFRGHHLTVAMVGHGPDVTADIDRCGSFFNVNVSLSGVLESDIDGHLVRTTPGQAVVFDAHRPVKMLWHAGTVQMAVRIDRSALERKLALALGCEVVTPLSFEALMDTSAGAGVAWSRSVLGALETYQATSPAVRQGLASELESAVMGQLLYTHPNNYTDALSGYPTPAPHRTVRRALDYLQEHLAETFTVDDVAAATGVSTRALQAAFRDELDETVTQVVRNERLARVHADLLEGIGSVSDIAYRWGFSHLSRFSAAYRQRYGQLPSETLRRGDPPR